MKNIIKTKEKILEALEDLKFEIGTKVKIKEDAIENGLLKEKCEQLIGNEGIVTKIKDVVTDDSEVEVRWANGYFNWIMPKDSLKIIK